jgi:hypothetical protein
MTSNTTPSGTASASSSYSATAPWYAFNNGRGLAGGTDGGWLSNGTSTGTLEYDFASAPVVVKAYSMCPWSSDNWNTRVPTAWSLQGYNGSSWVSIDTRSVNANTFTQYFNNYYTCLGNTTTYTNYRLNITANNGNAYVGVQRLQLYGSGSPGNTAQRPMLLLEDENSNAWEIGFTNQDIKVN